MKRWQEMDGSPTLVEVLLAAKGTAWFLWIKQKPGVTSLMQTRASILVTVKWKFSTVSCVVLEGMDDGLGQVPALAWHSAGALIMTVNHSQRTPLYKYSCNHQSHSRETKAKQKSQGKAGL